MAHLKAAPAAPHFRVEISADPRLLSPVRALIKTYFKDKGFDEERIERIVLAVDEACANSIRHAYDGDRGRTFELVLGGADGWVEVQVLDSGRPCPQERLNPKPMAEPEGADAVQPGGLGLKLIYETFDEVDFQTGRDQGNRLVMRAKNPAG